MEKEYIARLAVKKEDKSLVREYLTKKRIKNGKTYESSYQSCLEHARELTGRNLQDGFCEYSEKIGSWPGAFMYMVLIDHIGGMFRVIDKPDENNKFLTALAHFSDLSKNNARILYQLRNSLFHSFSLFDFPRNEKLFRPRIFTVHRGSSLVMLPRKDWSGDEKITKDNITYISLLEVSELAEAMHKNILENLKNSTLQIRIPKGGKLTLRKILNMNTLMF